jgi:hypothetical protein
MIKAAGGQICDATMYHVRDTRNKTKQKKQGIPDAQPTAASQVHGSICLSLFAIVERLQQF